MPKKNTTVRVDEGILNYYNTHYKNSHAGAKIAIEGFPFLREEALIQLKGKFTSKEILFLSDATQSDKLNPRDFASRRKWEAELADHFELHRRAEDDPLLGNVINKIRRLSEMQRFVLREMLYLQAKEENGV